MCAKVCLVAVSGPNDVGSSEAYTPEYLHQVFDDEPEESIVGHTDPKITVYYARGSMRPYLQISSTSARPKETDIEAKLREWFPEGPAS